MTGPAASPRIRWCTHTSTPPASPPGGDDCRRGLRSALALVLLTAVLGGCSFSNQLGSLMDNTDAHSGDATGSIGHDALRASDLSAGDLEFARAAAAEVLSRGKVTSLPWENPKTGAHGTVTPIAAAYEQDGITCRDFLASYTRGTEEAWLQGEACDTEGRWQVRSLAPWKGS